MNISEETPRLVLDQDRLEQNAARFLKRAEDTGVLLRPHLKTAKSLQVADVATGGRKSGITVSTLKEAEYFAANGYSDILYAVGVTPNKFGMVQQIQITTGQIITLITDDLSVAHAAVAFSDSADVPLEFLIEIDCGEHRGGLDAHSEDLLQIASVFDRAKNVTLRGVMTHAGHSYTTDDPSEIAEIAEAERQAAVTAAKRLRAVGCPCDVVSAGSTPTFLYGRSFEGLTEMRCGVYLFYDLAQQSRGICGLDEIAISVLATVIGHNRPNGLVTIDAGALALSKDTSANTFNPDAGFGYVCNPDTCQRLGELSVRTVHQEHGTIPVPNDSWFESLPVGSQVRILPNHACPTAAAFDSYLVMQNRSQVAEWARVNGW